MTALIAQSLLLSSDKAKHSKSTASCLAAIPFKAKYLYCFESDNYPRIVANIESQLRHAEENAEETSYEQMNMRRIELNVMLAALSFEDKFSDLKHLVVNTPAVACRVIKGMSSLSLKAVESFGKSLSESLGTVKTQGMEALDFSRRHLFTGFLGVFTNIFDSVFNVKYMLADFKTKLGKKAANLIELPSAPGSSKENTEAPWVVAYLVKDEPIYPAWKVDSPGHGK